MIVITGASDGLGRELANLFISEGKRVVGISRGECPTGVEHLKTNLLNESDISKAANVITADKEHLEVLVNAAGVLSIEKIEELTTSEVDKVLGTNIRAPLLLTSKLMKKIKKDGADIVNIASTVGHKGYQDQASYGSSKWAMRGFGANLQVELKDYPSRVITVSPGGFKTKLFQKATGTDNTKGGNWMNTKDVALVIKNLLDLPKNMEVSEIIINRK